MAIGNAYMFLQGSANWPGFRWLVVALAIMLPGSRAAFAADDFVIELPVPTVTVFAGDVLGESLLTKKRFRVRSSVASSFVRNIENAVGLAARRTLVAGKPIPVNALAAPSLVKEGSQVRIVFRSGGLEITAAGLALQSGGQGDVVSARNVDSGRTVRGIVGADGSVLVGDGS